MNRPIHTTFRAKIPIKNIHFFIGVGPKFDLQAASSVCELGSFPKMNNEELENYRQQYEMDKIKGVFGVKTEIGVVSDYKNFRYGLEFAYIHDFTNTLIDQRGRNFSIGVTLGYILNKKD